MINVKKVILLFVVSFFLGCCTWKSDIRENLTYAQTKPTTSPTPESKGQYINEQGWEIPTGKRKKTKSSNSYKSKTSDDKPVTVLATNYIPMDDLLIKEPFESIGEKKYGIIKVEFFTELKVNNNVFCYILMAHRTKPHPDTGRLVSSGQGFYFRYMDMDGDSKFETLIFEGKTDSVPNWVIK